MAGATVLTQGEGELLFVALFTYRSRRIENLSGDLTDFEPPLGVFRLTYHGAEV